MSTDVGAHLPVEGARTKSSGSFMDPGMRGSQGGKARSGKNRSETCVQGFVLPPPPIGRPQQRPQSRSLSKASDKDMRMKAQGSECK